MKCAVTNLVPELEQPLFFCPQLLPALLELRLVRSRLAQGRLKLRLDHAHVSLDLNHFLR